MCKNSFDSVHIIADLSRSYYSIRLLLSFLLGSYVGKSDDSEEQLVPAALNPSAKICMTRSKRSTGDGRRFQLNFTIGQPPS